MARAIRMAEQSAREAVAGIPEADSILMRRPDRAERTRAGAVDRLEEAVRITMKAAKKEPELREYATQANRAWAEAEGLRWRLAMSGRRIAHGEARKLAGPFMDEEDLVAHKQSVINDLAAAIRNHKQECPDHDVRVVDQKLWSWLDNYEFLNAKT
mgnify:CR=1 FL=1